MSDDKYSDVENEGGEQMEIQQVKSGETVLDRQTRQGSRTETETTFRAMMAEVTDTENVRRELEKRAEAHEEERAQELKDSARTTTRRLMPDGTIMVTELKGGKVADRYRYHPELIAVADPQRPPAKNPDGTEIPGTGGTKLRPYFNILSMC